jgi:hypothetical protein
MDQRLQVSVLTMCALVVTLICIMNMQQQLNTTYSSVHPDFMQIDTFSFHELFTTVMSFRDHCDISRALYGPRDFWMEHRDVPGPYELKVDGYYAIMDDGISTRWIDGVWTRNMRLLPPERQQRYLDKKYLKNFRMPKAQFDYIHDRLLYALYRQTTQMRTSLPSRKRLCIVLYWLATGHTQMESAEHWVVGQSTVCGIRTDVIYEFCATLVPDLIKFPVGEELIDVRTKFESLCAMPGCVGALDGTFMKIIKPSERFFDAYYCYKGYPAIIVLACVDADGIFNYVQSGAAGSNGDSWTYDMCSLKSGIDSGEYLSIPAAVNLRSPCTLIDGANVDPYIVSVCAFRLSKQ